MNLFGTLQRGVASVARDWLLLHNRQHGSNPRLCRQPKRCEQDLCQHGEGLFYLAT